MRYRATLAYVGTGFHGWQRQSNAARTVQAVLEEALAALDGAPVRAVAAGRTDAGVHADGQVVHFDLSRPLESNRVRAAANARLPPDARLIDVAPAPDGFDARRDALGKEYVYRWCRAAVIPPRDAPFVAPLSGRADLARMAAAAALFPGTRDFGVFGAQLSRGESSVRTLHDVRVEQRGNEISALFSGDGFLRGMIRSICGALADAARGRVDEDRLRRLIERGDRAMLSPKAPARGLTLLRVHYSMTAVKLPSPPEGG